MTVSYSNLKLWKEKFFLDSSDITIIFNGTEYMLNKQVLFVSETLRNLLTSGFKESFQDRIIIDVEEISKESWEMLLNYIYSEHIYFYNTVFNLRITNKTIPSIDSLSTDQILSLYVAKNYFDVRYVSFIDTEVENIVSQLFKEGNIRDIVILVNNFPSIDDIVNEVFNSLDKENIIKLMSICTMDKITDDNNQSFLSICNGVFDLLTKNFRIPDNINNINNIYQLYDYLQNRKLFLSESFSVKFRFQNPLVEDSFLNYILLEYPDYDNNKLLILVDNIMISVAPTRITSIQPTRIIKAKTNSLRGVKQRKVEHNKTYLVKIINDTLLSVIISGNIEDYY